MSCRKWPPVQRSASAGTAWQSLAWLCCPSAEKEQSVPFPEVIWSALVAGFCFLKIDIFVNTDKVGTSVHIEVNKSKMDTGVGFFSLIFANSEVKPCSVCDYAIQSWSSAQIFLQ